jgi:hypothetical protein
MVWPACVLVVLETMWSVDASPFPCMRRPLGTPWGEGWGGGGEEKYMGPTTAEYAVCVDLLSMTDHRPYRLTVCIDVPHSHAIPCNSMQFHAISCELIDRFNYSGVDG